jgi:acetyltransferase-like isoleucine patch superfamily enzyme
MIINYLSSIYSDIKYDYDKKNWIELKAKLKNIGNSVTIPAPYIIKNPQYISIGDNFWAMSNLRIEAWDNFQNVSYNPSIIIGNNVIFNSDCHIGCISSVIIEDNVLLASRVFISDHFHGNSDFSDISIPPRLRELTSKGSVLIKQNTWIGEGVSILPNVTIGKNCIIGANAVVTKDIPDNSIAVGVPAVVIRQF